MEQLYAICRKIDDTSLELFEILRSGKPMAQRIARICQNNRTEPIQLYRIRASMLTLDDTTPVVSIPLGERIDF